MTNINKTTFQGNLAVTSWKLAKPYTQNFKTTPNEDTIIKKSILDALNIDEPKKLTPKEYDFIHKLFEVFTNTKFENISGKKTAIFNGKVLDIVDSNPDFKGVEFSLSINV